MLINTTYCTSFHLLFLFVLGAEQEEDSERDGACHADPP